MHIPDLDWKWMDDLNTKGIGKVSNLDVLETLRDKHTKTEEIESMFINTMLYLRPVGGKTETTNTIMQSIVHAEVKSNLVKIETEGTRHNAWIQFMQEIMGESGEKIRQKYLLN